MELERTKFGKVKLSQEWVRFCSFRTERFQGPARFLKSLFVCSNDKQFYSAPWVVVVEAVLAVVLMLGVVAVVVTATARFHPLYESRREMLPPSVTSVPATDQRLEATETASGSTTHCQRCR